VEWSPEGDEIHDFVAKFCKGRWPVPGESWLTLSTGDWKAQTMRFEGFRNLFWATPSVRLSHGDVDELEEVEIALRSIHHCVVRNPWQADAICRVDECDLLRAQGHRVLVRLMGGHADVYELMGRVDHPVGLQLRLRKGALAINIFASRIESLRRPPWCAAPTFMPFVLVGTEGRPPRIGSELRVALFGEREPRVTVFHSWSQTGQTTFLECTIGEGFVRIDARRVQRAEQLAT
jgi:hypothetical protein